MNARNSGPGLRAFKSRSSIGTPYGNTCSRAFGRGRCAIVSVLLGAFVLVSFGCGGQAGDPLAEAREHLKNGRPEASIAPLRTVLDETPSQPEANYLLGKALLRIGEPARAVWPLRRAAESSEYAVEAGLLLARALLQGRNSQDAISAIDAVLAIDPNNIAALKLRMETHLRSSDFEDALGDIDRVLEKEPENLEVMVPRIQALLGLKRIDEVEESLGKAMLELEGRGDDASPEMKATLCAAHAVFTFEKGETEQADVLLTECLEKFPNNVTVVTENVKFNDQIGKRKRATEILQKASEDTGSSVFRKALANRMRGLRRPDEELKLLLEETVENPSPTSWFELGDHYARNDDFTAAVAAFEQAIAASVNPDPMLRFAYADTLIQAGEYEKARQKAADFRNEQAVFKDLLIGRIHLEEGDPAAALKSFESGIRLWPNNGVARYMAGQAAEKLGNFDRAISEYREALRRNPEQSDAGVSLAELYEALGIHQDALDAIGRHARSHPLDSRSYRITVRIAHHLSQHKIVTEALARLAELPGEQASAVALEAELVGSDKGPATAVQAIEKSAIDLASPDNAEALRVLLDQFELMGESDAAAKRIGAALEAHPNEAVFHALNAQFLRATGKPVDQVRGAYERAIELDAEYVPALIGLAEIAAEADQRAEAVALYDRAAELDTDEAAASYAAAQLLSGPDPKEAARRYEELLMDHPRHGRAANSFAILLIESGELDRAMLYAKRANKFVSAPDALETIGWIHLQRDEPELAVKAFTRVVERRPQAALARFRLGLAYLATGDEENARRTFREVIEGGAKPASDQALAELARLDAGVGPE